MTAIAKTIKKILKERDWDEVTLARVSGLHQPTVHRILSGESKNPKTSSLIAIAKALNVSVGYITNEEEYFEDLVIEPVMTSNNVYSPDISELREESPKFDANSVYSQRTTIKSRHNSNLPKKAAILIHRIEQAAEQGMSDSDFALITKLIDRMFFEKKD